MSVIRREDRPALPPGTRLPHGASPESARFELLEVLGGGCFGTVYRARQLVFGHRFRDVALKLFDSGAVTAGNVQEVFHDAMILVALQEENPSPEIARHLVRVYDAGVLQTSPAEAKPFFSMQLIPGNRTLEFIVRRFRGGIMPVETSLHFMRQILVPLAWMHTLDSGCVHGDLKPDNLLVVNDNEVVVVDFGYAARLTLGARGAAISYQSPETLLGNPGYAPADIYALGLIWYQLLTSRHPFESAGLEATADGDDAAFVQAHLKARHWPIRPASPAEDPTAPGRIAPPSEINEDLRNHPQVEQMLCRCLEWSPAARFPNARVLLAEIDRYLDRGTTSAIESPATPRQPACTLAAPPPERVAADVEALLKNRRTDEALARVDAALKTHPRSAILLVTRARVLIRTGRFDLARDALQAARAITSNAPEIDEATAEWYEAQGNPDAAAPFRKRALERQRSAGGHTPRFRS